MTILAEKPEKIWATDTGAQDDLFKRIGFEPTPEQAEILAASYRFNLVAGGEQAGKSRLAAAYLLSHVFDPEKLGLYWLVGADYAETEREFHYLVEDFTQLGLLRHATKRVDPGQILLADGTRIITKSAKDNRRLAREAPDGIIGCEASQLSVSTFERMRGRTAPAKGWLFLAGTFEREGDGAFWYQALWKAWQSGADDRKSWSLPSWTNLHMYPGGRQDPEIVKLEQESSDEYFMERIAGSPVPPRGLVFQDFRPDIHIRDIAYIPGEPVYLWVDPGYSGSAYAVEAVQIINDRPQIFDEVYEKGLVTEQIISIIQQRTWSKDVRHGTVDVYAYQHHGQHPLAEQWQAPPPDGLGLFMASNRVGIPEGTERLKTFLKINPLTNEPGIIFSPKCRGLLSEFGAAPYPFGTGEIRPYAWETDRDGNIVGKNPKDKFNDGIKATIYGLVEQWGFARKASGKIRVKRW